MKLFAQKIASMVVSILAIGLMTLPRSSSARTNSEVDLALASSQISATTLNASQGLMTLPAAAFKAMNSELHGWQPLQATLLAGLVAPKSAHYILATLTAKNGNAMEARLWRARGKSRGLFLMIPGTGSDATAGLANSLAETIVASGYDVFILANPFSSAFQKSFSSDGLVGFPQKDLPDTEAMLWAGLVAYTSQFGPPQKLGLIGYSLGGLYTALEARRGAAIQFDKFVVLNPTINFQYGMDQVDKMMRVQIEEPLSIKQILKDVFAGLGATIEGITTLNLNRLKDALPSNAFENSQIIGMSFSSNLVEITKNLASTQDFSDDAAQIKSTIKGLTFAKYMNLVGPALRKKGYFSGRSYAALAAQADLRDVLRLAKAGADIEVIDNEDDILVTMADLRDVHVILGSRMTVFDAGGHCGNFWVPSFKRQLGQVISR